jgi:hypothetical protein
LRKEKKMQKAHDASMNTYWRNKPDPSTPIVAEKKNQLEQAVDTIDDRVIVLDSSKANQTDLLQAVRSIGYTAATGTFRVTFFNGTYIDIDTDIEKIAINFDYDDDPTSSNYQKIIITLQDGTKKYIDLSALITEYEFNSSQTIQAIVSGGEVSFEVINGSITEDKLEPNFLANCRIEVALAEGYAEDSEAWAVGQRQGVDVPDTDETYHNNSTYYSEQSETSAQSALETKGECEDILEEVQAAASNFQFWVDTDTGEMMYEDTSNYSFSINTTTGNLEWEVVA